MVGNVGYERLVLTACHPLYSAAQRIVAFGEQKDISPFGAGNRIWQGPVAVVPYVVCLERAVYDRRPGP